MSGARSAERGGCGVARKPKKKNPVERRSTRTSPGGPGEHPLQRTMFRYRVDEGQYPRERAELAPDVPQPIPGLYQPVEAFVYEDVPTPKPKKTSKDISYVPGKSGVHPRARPRQGLLHSDPNALLDELLDELDALAALIVESVNEWLVNEQGEAEKKRNNQFLDYMEDDFNTWLSNEPGEELIRLAENQPNDTQAQHVKEMIRTLEATGDAEAKEALVEAIRDRSNWKFEMGESSDASDYSNQQDEMEVSATVNDIVVPDYDESGHQRTTKYSNVEEILDRVFEIFVEMEGGDQEAAEVAMPIFVKNVKQQSDAFRADYNGQRKYAEFGGYVSAQSCAKLHISNLESDLETLIEQFAGNADADYDEDEDDATEPDEDDGDVVKGRVAKLSDFTEQIPFEPSDPALAAMGWTVWNLSSADLRAEGKAQSHCLGDEGMGYADAVQRGEIYIWSVKDSQGKSKFTFEVARPSPKNAYRAMTYAEGDGRGLFIAGYKQIKGKGNRLPGWAFKRDYDPYGDRPYFPRLKPVLAKDGTVLQPPLAAEDVRKDEVLWLWDFIKTGTPLADLYATRPAWATTKFTAWAGVERTLQDDQTLADIQRPADSAGPTDAIYTLQQFCQDMIPGLCAVFAGKLFNGPDWFDEPHENPDVKLEPRSFDAPYRRARKRR